jgi:hypothetical protein
MPGGGKSLAPFELNNHTAGRFLEKLLSKQLLLRFMAHPESRENSPNHLWGQVSTGCLKTRHIDRDSDQEACQGARAGGAEEIRYAEHVRQLGSESLPPT